MLSSRPAARSLLVATFTALALSAGAGGCGADLREPPVLPVAKDPLRVASDGEGEGRVIVVNANEPRTLVGHFRAGQRVQLSVLDAQWTDEPGPDLLDARGAGKRTCKNTFARTCIGNGAPFMGLVLITVPDTAAAAMARKSACGEPSRLFIPNGAEFTVPTDVELELAPNDWEDGVENNSGAIEVEVERAAGKGERALETAHILVQAASPRTFAGRFAAGEYARITVKKGTWRHDPGAAFMGSSGHPTEKCGSGGHECIAGEGVPLMGLVLLLSSCSEDAMFRRESRVERAHIPDGAEVHLASDAHLYLAPNDFEDGFADNSGSARVRVRVLGK